MRERQVCRGRAPSFYYFLMHCYKHVLDEGLMKASDLMSVNIIAETENVSAIEVATRMVLGHLYRVCTVTFRVLLLAIRKFPAMASIFHTLPPSLCLLLLFTRIKKKASKPFTC
jgi:hypothetical protein